MNIDKILQDLKKNHVWGDYGKDAPELRPCPFCGGEAWLVISNPVYGDCGAAVRCRRCHMRGPRASIYATLLKPNGNLSTPVLYESLERGINAAMDAWNSGTADSSRLGNMKLGTSA